VEKIRAIRAFAAKGMPIKAISRESGVSAPWIRKILRGQGRLDAVRLPPEIACFPEGHYLRQIYTLLKASVLPDINTRLADAKAKAIR
jgi:predicted transcriptional regulator